MTQKQYLSELSRHLRFWFSEGEIEDIISDMKECFDAGAAEGKSEDDISLRLGNPKDAAASLLTEQKKDPAGFAVRLLDHWVPAFISAFVLGVFFYFGFKHEIIYTELAEIALYALPMLIWLLMERASLFKSILKYKADLFTFAGSVLIFITGLIYNIFLRSVVIIEQNYRIPPLSVLVAVLIFASMVMLLISMWKYAPRPLFFAAVIVSALSVYKLIQICHYFVTRFGMERYNSSGLYNEYFYDLIFLWGGLLIVWSLFRRNSLTLPSAYFSLTAVAEIFYIWQSLARLDPTDDRSTSVLLNELINYRIYLIGSILAAAMLVMVIIVKKTGSRGKDDA